MRQKIYIALTAYFLALMVFAAFAGEAAAQPRKGGKPNDRARKLVTQGNAFFKQKDFRSAVNKYAEAIVVAPNYPEAHYLKGSAHYLLDEYDAAIEDWDQSLELGYQPIKIYEARWEAHFKKKNYDAALSDVQQALRIEPSSNYFTLSLADVQRLKGNHQEAIAAYKKALPASRNRGDIYFFIAASHFSLNETVEQNKAASEAINNSTQYPGESYTLIADALVKAKKPTEAITAYERALNVNPEMPDVYLALSSLYQGQSRLNEAIATVRKGTKLYPENGSMFVNLTWFYSLADRPVEAVDVGKEAVRLLPDDYMSHTNLCRAYNDMGQYSQATAACSKALLIKPDDGETYLYLARANDEQKKAAVAKQYYKKAVSGLLATTSANPENSDAWYLLGNAYYWDDQKDKAIEAYRQSLELNPKFPKAILNLGTMYFLNKNLPMAQEQHAKLVKIDPPTAKKLKNILDGK